MPQWRRIFSSSIFFSFFFGGGVQAGAAHVSLAETLETLTDESLEEEFGKDEYEQFDDYLEMCIEFGSEPLVNTARLTFVPPETVFRSR